MPRRFATSRAHRFSAEKRTARVSRMWAEADARGELDWDLQFVDTTIIRAHQHAAGARRTGTIGG
jgi:hypothetical protein